MTYAKKAVKHRIAAHNDQTGYDQTYMASPAKISRLGAKVQPTRKPNANTYWDRQRQDENYHESMCTWDQNKTGRRPKRRMMITAKILPHPKRY